MADGNIKVSVESAVHDALAEVARTLMNDYGLRIKSVNFLWSGIEVMGETVRRELSSVVIESDKRF